MKVENRMYVAIDYTLSLESGERVDSSKEGSPLGFVAGTGQIIPGLESALMGKEQGESLKVTLEPEEGYGPVDERLFQDIPKGRFPDNVEVAPGMAFQATGPRGPMAMTVVSVNKDDTVTVDLNHPMAGKRLFFDVKVVEVRDARPGDMMPASGGGCACGPSEEGGGGGCNPGSASGPGGCACG